LGAVKSLLTFFVLKEQRMPQIGTDAQPVMLNSKKRGKTLGLAGSFFERERKKKYDENYDRIFKKKDK
tara:strand:+ start:139 stop:342 length:204 start_codon:yes stop_codon:yes gene_type:complete